MTLKFEPKVERIVDLYEDELNKSNLEGFLDFFGEDDKVGVYVDYGNVRPWSDSKIKWHVDVKRMGQFFKSFGEISKKRFYYGYIKDAMTSKITLCHAKKVFDVSTKEVKDIKIDIDTTSLKDSHDTSLLKSFIRKSFLKKISIEDVEYLNGILEKLNKGGTLYFKDKKCNFDVEMGVDMLLDNEMDGVNTLILMTHDSDFIDPVKRLLANKAKVVMLCPMRGLASEFYELQNGENDGHFRIFDIVKFKQFLCKLKEMDMSIKQKSPGLPDSSQ